MIGPRRTACVAACATAALWVATAALLGSTTALAATPPGLGTARLQGTFALSGRITVAVHVKGEHPGQQISRTWTFVPLCTAGPCSSVELIRGRATGTDTLTLHETAPGQYSGRGQFYAPLGCAARINPRGEAVPFTIGVRVTAASTSPTGAVATTIAATYTNRSRLNLTRCVALSSHDAAVYQGQLQ